MKELNENNISSDSEELELMQEEISENKDSEEISLDKEENKKPYEVNEERGLRTEYKKVFNMSDGTKKAVFYARPVHTFDEEKKEFVEIDNSLKEEEDGRHYVNRKNSFKARFSKEEGNEELFSIEKGEYKVKMSLVRRGASKGRGVKARLKDRKIKFENLLNNALLEYEVEGDRVKENIVINDRSEYYRYTFRLECENLRVRFLENEREVSFLSNETDEEIFNIPAPFMSDADGEYSDNVFYEISETEEGKTILAMIADSGWINAKERKFPVKIDPQIVISRGRSAV